MIGHVVLSGPFGPVPEVRGHVSHVILVSPYLLGLHKPGVTPPAG